MLSLSRGSTGSWGEGRWEQTLSAKGARNQRRNTEEEIHPWYGQHCKNSDLFQFQLEWNNGIEGTNFISHLLLVFFSSVSRKFASASNIHQDLPETHCTLCQFFCSYLTCMFELYAFGWFYILFNIWIISFGINFRVCWISLLMIKLGRHWHCIRELKYQKGKACTYCLRSRIKRKRIKFSCINCTVTKYRQITRTPL